MTWKDAEQPREPKPLRDVLGAFTDRLGIARPRVIGAVFEGWASLVGEPLASHVRPVGLRDGVLHLVADEPGWASQMRFLEADLVRLVNERIAATDDESVHTLSVRVVGQRRR